MLKMARRWRGASYPQSLGVPGAPSPPGKRKRGASGSARMAAGLALGLGLVATVALLGSASYRPASEDYAWWTDQGCPVKILAGTARMNETMQAARKAGLVPSDLGAPLTRRPRTAILNFVKYHIEVAAALAFHFQKIRHNTTVFVRNEDYGMRTAIKSWQKGNWKKLQGFFDNFYEFDVVVVATYPTCHLETFRELLSFGLPQRYIAMVHNPDLLNDTATTQALEAGQVRLLTIAPHVGRYAAGILAERGVTPPDQDWLAPVAPITFPEECGLGGWQDKTPACARDRLWRRAAPPPGLAALHAQLKGLGRGGRTAREAWAAARRTGAPPPRAGFCIQGKLDPARRRYDRIFAEMLAHKDALLEYYELLHSCIALVPAFASPAYYVNKGSSTIGAALVTDTPLIATRGLLQAYSFLEESAVFLADEAQSDVEAMLWVLSLDRAEWVAKAAALRALRLELYDRNLQVLQRMLGEAYVVHRQLAEGEAPQPVYFNMNTATPGIRYSGCHYGDCEQARAAGTPHGQARAAGALRAPPEPRPPAPCRSTAPLLAALRH
eukprot:scaffold21.g2208.t1